MILSVFMMFYRLAWTVLLPFVLLYLWRRGRKDPEYTKRLGERFGIYQKPLPQNAIWVHAVSLGELRSGIALINMMLARGDNVIVTNITPAGRREATSQFADAIASGQLAVVWLPFDMAWTFARFFRACAPKIGLTLEFEVWPRLVFAARRAGVPVYMCNGQYGSRPMARDSRGLRLRQRIIRELSGAFVKSDLQAQRFASIGVENVTVTGELRFDQPVPPPLVAAAKRAKATNLAPFIQESRKIIAIASGVEAEEDIYADMITQMAEGKAPPLFIYIPRAPERFDPVATGLTAAGLNVTRRSLVFDADLTAKAPLPPDTHVLVGDSLGEMYFYLDLADLVIVGSGYTPHGAHNIIEPLARGKTVITGPTVWPIEYPFVEAAAAGLAQIVDDPAQLPDVLQQPVPDESAAIQAFLKEHGGASARTLTAIDSVIGTPNPSNGSS